MARPARLRQFWWVLHRWIGIGLLVLLVPIAVSDFLLVYHDELDALVNPKRWTVSGPQLALLPAQYIAAASAVVAANETVTGVRFPRSAGAPVVVLARQQVDPGERAAPAIFQHLPRSPNRRGARQGRFPRLVGRLSRVFHENLTIPQYSGRQIVGWAGVGMLILSLTGIWLWWPRRASVLSGLRWRRAPHTSTNLHHTLGFWISIPLAIVSLPESICRSRRRRAR